MPPLEIYLMRHGETEMNAQHIMQGSGIDAPLNNKGLYQAQKFYEYYKTTPFVAVYSSNLQRSVQTVAPFVDDLIPYKVLSDLRELNWGELEGIHMDNKIKSQLYKIIHEWKKGNLDYKIKGGESPNEALTRISNAIEYIESKYLTGKVLICGHGRMIRITLAYLLGYGLENMDLFEHRNTSLNILGKVGSHYVAKVLNDISHLG